MYFLAGIVFLFAFTVFASGETCNQVTNCLELAGSVQKAAEAGNLADQCRFQKQMVDCFTSALADCQTVGSSYPQESINQLENSLSAARSQYENLCANSEGNTDSGDGGLTYNAGSGGSVPETASCMDAAKCVFDTQEMQNALKDNRIGEVCAMISPSAKCLRSAFNDCKAKKMLPEEQLQGMSQQVEQVGTLVGQHCKGGMSVSVGSDSGNTGDVTQSVSCTDAMTCTPNSEKLVEAMTNGRHDEACVIIKRSYSCLKSAIADCKAKNLLSGDALDSMETSYKSYEPQIAQYCQSPTGSVHCMDSATCIPDTEKLTDAITSNRFQEGCQILTAARDCLNSALQDCKARGVMSEEDIKSMEEQQKTYEPQIQQMCQQTTSGGVSCFQMQSCAPNEETTTKLKESIDKKEMEEVCHLMQPAMKCQMSAMEDCKKRGVVDESVLKEMEESVAMARTEMNKYCSSGNSASMSMFHIFMGTLLVFLINLITSKM